EQVLVGRVLRTSGVGVRDPDGAQAEHIGEAVVGQRSTEIGKNGRRAAGGALDRAGGEHNPWVLGVAPARPEKSAAAAAYLDLSEIVAVEVAAQRRNDVVHIGADDVTQLAMRARLARNGVDWTLRRSGDESQHLKAVPGEDALAGVSSASPQ